MASDSTAKVTPGSPFRAPPATIWNNMVDAGQAFADRRLSSGAPAATRSRDTDLLRLKNSSGASRAKGEILKIDGKVIETVTDEHIWLDGVEPTNDCRFGILKAPALDDEVVTAQVSGVCMALVNVTDADHEFAQAIEEEYVLESSDSGPLEILYKPDGTGELDCVVRFAGTGTSMKRVQLLAYLDVEAEVSATVLDLDPMDDYAWVDSGNTLTVRLWACYPLASGTVCTAMSYRGRWYVTPIACC